MPSQELRTTLQHFKEAGITRHPSQTTDLSTKPEYTDKLRNAAHSSKVSEYFLQHQLFPQHRPASVLSLGSGWAYTERQLSKAIAQTTGHTPDLTLVDLNFDLDEIETKNTLVHQLLQAGMTPDLRQQDLFDDFLCQPPTKQYDLVFLTAVGFLFAPESSEPAYQYFSRSTYLRHQTILRDRLPLHLSDTAYIVTAIRNAEQILTPNSSSPYKHRDYVSWWVGKDYGRKVPPRPMDGYIQSFDVFSYSSQG